ncbi:FAD-dependent oxidoreductase [Lichenicoccus sp.]|uniref:FAD-dependent oxidoreductase n=1 Tax=Lichenicoccus sp. TaxID=2781899 RepID=UPI003D152933
MQKVATLHMLKQHRPVRVMVGETAILLLRDGAVVHAFGADCPHAGAPLEQGAVCDGRLVCPWHKASFAIADGALLEPPALDPLTRYPVEIIDGDVRVSDRPLPLPPAVAAGPADPRTMLIVGAGAAGTAAAAALREFGFTGRVVLVGAEADAPYDRTALSKFVLQGAMPPDEVWPLRENDFWASHRIERVHGEAVALDQGARRVTLADGSVLVYDALLIATGGIPRGPDVPGADLVGVHLLRSLDDARSLLPALEGGARVVIAGASFIGLEAASALRERDVPVTVVANATIPFERQFGTEIGTMFRRLHEAHGVVFMAPRRIASIEGVTRVQAVVLDDGTRLEADVALVGYGVHPATAFAASLDLARDGGILVDADMRATDQIFAAGDVARFPLGIADAARIEHWRVAQQHARVAARGMLGGDARFEQPPFFWTYHYGKRFEYLGHAETFDRVVVDGDLATGEFLARQYDGSRVVGIIACQREAETAALAHDLNRSPG